MKSKNAVRHPVHGAEMFGEEGKLRRTSKESLYTLRI